MKLVLLGVLGFAAMWAYLAIERHAALKTNAFDLGYVTQTLWYTAHGQPFRFTTLEGVPFSPEGTLDPSQLHRPQSLLAFHVEPILLAIAPIFAIWPYPRLLLALQAIGLAAGALPATALARLRTKSEVAAIIFGFVYLSSPSIAAAALSDFHAVTLGATFLLAALYYFAAGHRRRALVSAGLAAATREDAAIAVAALGAYLGVRYLLASRRQGRSHHPGPLRRREGTNLTPRPSPGAPGETNLTPIPSPGAPGEGIGTPSHAEDPLATYPRESRYLLLGAGLWVLLVFFAITPFFNGSIHALLHGGQGVGSIFWHRYEWLGSSPLSALRNAIVKPRLWIDWFAQRDVLAYLLTLFLSGGGVALVAPEALAIGLPLLLQNTLSSFDWMRSGGAHYSTILVPIVVFAGIEGVRRATMSRWRVPAAGLAALALVAAVANHVWFQASPLVPGLTWPMPTERDFAVERVLDGIPSTASVSATSAAYPHVASRAQAYWFPALQDATYVAIDAARSTDPIPPAEVAQRADDLRGSGQYGVAAAAPGFLLLQQGVVDPEIPADFYAFAMASPSDVAAATRLPAYRFGDHLVLDAYRTDLEPTQTIFGPSATVTTYWHVDAPTPDSTSFVFSVSRRSDGAMVGQFPDRAPEAVWYPTSRWPANQTVKLTIHLDRVRDLQAIGVAVVDPTTGQRLPLLSAPGAPTWENGTIARIARLDGA